MQTKERNYYLEAQPCADYLEAQPYADLRKARRTDYRRISALIGISLLLCFLFASCRYSRPNLDVEGMSNATRDSLTYLYERHYTLNRNLEVVTDSVVLACLPVKDCYETLYKGDRVVVAEFAVYPVDSVDSIWVKLAHSQEIQGWISEREMMQSFVPTDSISQSIYLFSDTHASYFVIIFALFIGVWVFRQFRRKQLKMVYFNDIDSAYPLFLCLLMAFSAMVYESVQVFAPETWEHFYFNPTLSPFKVPFILSVFLLSIWLFIIILLAVLDDLFRQLQPAAAIFYLLGLASCCIFCYFFFIFTTQIYIGYGFFAAFVWIFLKKRATLAAYRYRCGHCGQKLKKKGRCPACGAINT
ncbi:zinc ribbon domain-containing protein [Bacteroides sp. UBA939]|uniref:zinc ribbon domain-containing protein n=1 Tax=Bacteroides sp. UBA939 TaxID=1946092 RepID=UPI0025BF57E5|nr:zinc ribbon domain-containing protein [Bacteroides sp. UBA939]